MFRYLLIFSLFFGLGVSAEEQPSSTQAVEKGHGGTGKEATNASLIIQLEIVSKEIFRFFLENPKAREAFSEIDFVKFISLNGNVRFVVQETQPIDIEGVPRDCTNNALTVTCWRNAVLKWEKDPAEFFIMTFHELLGLVGEEVTSIYHEDFKNGYEYSGRLRAFITYVNSVRLAMPNFLEVSDSVHLVTLTAKAKDGTSDSISLYCFDEACDFIRYVKRSRNEEGEVVWDFNSLILKSTLEDAEENRLERVKIRTYGYDLRQYEYIRDYTNDLKNSQSWEKVGFYALGVVAIPTMAIRDTLYIPYKNYSKKNQTKKFVSKRVQKLLQKLAESSSKEVVVTGAEYLRMSKFLRKNSLIGRGIHESNQDYVQALITTLRRFDDRPGCALHVKDGYFWFDYFEPKYGNMAKEFLEVSQGRSLREANKFLDKIFARGVCQ